MNQAFRNYKRDQPEEKLSITLLDMEKELLEKFESDYKSMSKEKLIETANKKDNFFYKKYTVEKLISHILDTDKEIFGDMGLDEFQELYRAGE